MNYIANVTLTSSRKYLVSFIVHIYSVCESLSSAVFPCIFFTLIENLSSDCTASSPSALNSPGLGAEGLNRRRKKRTSIETNIRVALEKSFMEVSEVDFSSVSGCDQYYCWGL